MLYSNFTFYFLLYYIIFLYFIFYIIVSLYLVGKCINAIYYGRLFGALEIRAETTGTIRLFGTSMGTATRTRRSVHDIHISDH